MNIKTSKAIIHRMRELGISMRDMHSAIFVLLALYNDEIDLLDFADQENKEKTLLSLYKHLAIKELLQEDKAGAIHFKLTKLGESIAEFLSEEIEHTIEEEIKHQESNNPEDWITDYIKLFPEGKPYGRPYRISKSECLPKMLKFLDRFATTKEEVLAATEMWINSYKNSADGIEKMRDSRYFISKEIPGKGIVSDLETAIEMYRDTKDNPIQNFNKNLMDII
jgi:hypothetical protein